MTAWPVLARLILGSYVFPIIGGRKVEHLRSNIEALSLELSRDEMHAIEDAAPFDVGWPHSFFFAAAGNYRTDMKSDDIQILSANWRLETVPSIPVSPSGDLLPVQGSC